MEQEEDDIKWFGNSWDGDEEGNAGNGGENKVEWIDEDEMVKFCDIGEEGGEIFKVEEEVNGGVT